MATTVGVRDVSIGDRQVSNISELLVNGKRMPKYIFKQLQWSPRLEEDVEILGFVCAEGDGNKTFVLLIDGELYKFLSHMVLGKSENEVINYFIESLACSKNVNRQLFIGA
jgi:hypothetical protein